MHGLLTQHLVCRWLNINTCVRLNKCKQLYGFHFNTILYECFTFMHVLRKLVDLGAENCGVLFYIYTYVKNYFKSALYKSIQGTYSHFMINFVILGHLFTFFPNVRYTVYCQKVIVL